jgi:hypothetical protein
VIVTKEFFEKNVCSRVIIGKAIAILNIGDKISWDETPGIIGFYVALEGWGGRRFIEEWLRYFLIDEGNEYIFNIKALSKGTILQFELREVVEKK